MRKEIKILIVIAFVVIVGGILGAGYYRNSVQNTPVTATSGRSNQPAVSPETLVRPDSPTLGPENAKVTLVEFLDPECESCAAFSPSIKKILKDYDGKIRLVIRYVPNHQNSMRAATLLEAAGEQGKYWQMQDILYQRQAEWGERHGAPPTAQVQNIDALFEKYAVDAGLDVAKYKAAAAENRYREKIERDRRDAQTLGVRKTPSFFVNGRLLQRFSEADLRLLIEDEMKK